MIGLYDWFTTNIKPQALEQHDPDWNSRGDKVACSNKAIERADRFQSA